MESIKDAKRVFSSCASAILYRRSVFNHMGYFDENFFAYYEDIDIGYRANIMAIKTTLNLFKQGYKAILCNKDKYLLALIRYIHQNPVRAGMEEGLNYQYASHKNYISMDTDDLVNIHFL